ncbi:DUF3817 domain-containing protein [Pilimelia columellifera]|uniref:DUF3817 domain-containing protein n=1 Tax=Pilimelia columellifera subsp. columellifera TaxID=706583 RepID=A0ABP6B2G0_9ACTN
MAAALTRYRAIAYVVGVVLIVLMVVGMPMKYLDVLGRDETVVTIVSPVHGFLYMAYLVATFDLARRGGWGLRRMALAMLAGTVPFFSFYGERVVTGWVRESTPEPVPAA